MSKHYSTNFSKLVLAGLQRKPLYEGVEEDEIRAGRRLTPSKLDRRRRAAKLAKAARKAQR